MLSCPFSQAMPVANENPAAQFGGFICLGAYVVSSVSPEHRSFKRHANLQLLVLLRYFPAAHLSRQGGVKAKEASGGTCARKWSTPGCRYRNSHTAQPVQHRTGDLGSIHRVALSHYSGAQPCGFSDDLENGLSDT